MLKGCGKRLVERNPPQSWPWNQNDSCSCCNDSWCLEQLKKCVTDKYFEKKFEPKSPSFTGKVCCHYDSWATGVYMAFKFDRNSGGKTSQIE